MRIYCNLVGMFGLMEAVAETSCILYRFRITKSAGKLIRMAKKTVENELDLALSHCSDTFGKHRFTDRNDLTSAT